MAMEDPWEKYSSTFNKDAKMFNQKRKMKPCDCGRGNIYTDQNSKFNPVVNGVQKCQECKLDWIYASVGRNRG